MNKHRSYLSIHIYTFRYDVHCNWHHCFLFFFLFFFRMDYHLKLTDTENVQTVLVYLSVSSRHVMLHTRLPFQSNLG